jgi:predicted dehydrogenase
VTGGSSAEPAGPPLRFGIVGHGWRADFYLRLASRLPARFDCVGVVARRPEVAARLAREWGVATFATVDELVAATAPEVVVTSVPREANPGVVQALVALGTPVLAETPPAADVEGLRELWAAVGDSGLVQVAEQHPFLPVFAAVRALIGLGVLGAIGSVHVTWTHDYHGVALIRSLLGLGAEPVRIQAARDVRPLLEGPDREGWPAEPAVRPSEHTIALLQAAGRTGVYDFTEGQWFNPFRRRHLVLRGDHGELVGNDVTWAAPDGSPLSAPIVRRQTGLDGNLEGADLDSLTWAGRVLYRNPFPGARLSDEEIAIATCLEATGRWRRGEAPEPYPLADACQDQLVALHVHAAADAGCPVQSGDEPWSAHVRAGVAPSSRSLPAAGHLIHE